MRAYCTNIYNIFSAGRNKNAVVLGLEGGSDIDSDTYSVFSVFWDWKSFVAAACMFAIAASLTFAGQLGTTLVCLWTSNSSDKWVLIGTVSAFFVGFIISLLAGFFICQGMKVPFGKACLLACVFLFMLGVILHARSELAVLKKKQSARIKALMSDFNDDLSIYNRLRDLRSGKVDLNKPADSNDQFLLVWAEKNKD